MATPYPILIVEDSRADVFLIREALKSVDLQADLQVAPDGETALRFFEQVDGDEAIASPALVILDINLPRKKGGEVLQQMRTSRRCGNVMVLVVTSSDSECDRNIMSRLGVKGFFSKTSNFEDFMKLGWLVKELLGAIPQTAI